MVFFSFIFLLSYLDASTIKKPTNIEKIQQKEERYNLVNGLKILSKHAILLDFDTKDVILKFNSEELMNPSSMTKILTALVAFKCLKEEKVKLDDIFTVSSNAWRKEGTTMFLNQGQRVSVKDLLMGLVCVSANDGSIALAEGIAGSEASYVYLMNRCAQKIGMHQSHFTNVTGLPDRAHQTNCVDLAKLTYFLIKEYPEFYKLFKEKSFSFNNINQFNKNLLLFKNSIYDGVKTGFSSVAGYGIVASAYQPQQKRRLILVINGLHSEGEREREAEALLNWGFSATRNEIFFNPYEPVGKVKVRFGNKRKIQIGSNEVIGLTVSGFEHKKPEIRCVITKLLEAPLKKGNRVGDVIITYGDKIKTLPLIALEDIERVGFIKRFWENFL